MKIEEIREKEARQALAIKRAFEKIGVEVKWISIEKTYKFIENQYVLMVSIYLTGGIYFHRHFMTKYKVPNISTIKKHLLKEYQKTKKINSHV